MHTKIIVSCASDSNKASIDAIKDVAWHSTLVGALDLLMYQSRPASAA